MRERLIVQGVVHALVGAAVQPAETEAAVRIRDAQTPDVASEEQAAIGSASINLKIGADLGDVGKAADLEERLGDAAEGVEPQPRVAGG